MSDPEKIVQHIIPATNDVMYVSWNYKEESVATSPCTNVVIATYTTAQARLTLFEYLYKLDKVCCIMIRIQLYLSVVRTLYTNLIRGLYSVNLQTSWRITALLRLSKHSFQADQNFTRIGYVPHREQHTIRVKLKEFL